MKMENKKLEILVIEDNPEHLKDAKSEIQKRIDKGENINANYATTMLEAEELMEQKKFDGIISDIFFPYDSESYSDIDRIPTGWDKGACLMCYELLKNLGVNYPDGHHTEFEVKIVEAADKWMERHEMHPTGVLMIPKAEENEIPIVLCTDTYHHGYKTQPVFAYAMQKDVRVIDSHNDPEGHAAKKDWAEAVNAIFERIENG
jgi:CheY-like chemotaxis protein